MGADLGISNLAKKPIVALNPKHECPMDRATGAAPFVV